MISKVSLTEALRAPFGLEAYIMHTSSRLEVIHLILQPGQVIPQHANPVDVIVCLIEGEVILCAGDQRSILSLYEVAEVNKIQTAVSQITEHLLPGLLLWKKL